MRTLARMSWTLPTLLALGASPTMAQVDPEAQAVIASAREAWAGVNALAATVKMTGEGAIGAMAAPKIEASVLLMRDPGARGFWLQRATGEGSLPGQEGPTRFDAAWDPADRQISWIDHEGKVLHRAPTGSGPAFTIASTALPVELITAEPFGDEMRATTMTLEDPATVDGVLCDVVKVTYANGMSVARWSIGRADHLPRKHEMLFETGPMQGAIVRTMGGLEVNAPLSEVAFQVDQPAGYTLEEIAAPKRAVIEPLDVAPLSATGVVRTRGSINPPAPRFVLEDADGISVALEEYRGSVVLLDFWGTWCLPCKKATPFLQQLHEDYADKGVKLFGLACREKDRQAPIDYFKENNLGYTLLLGADGVAKDMQVKAYPTYILIDTDGGIVETWVGGKPEDTFAKIRRAIDKELGRVHESEIVEDYRDGSVDDAPAVSEPDDTPDE